MKLFAKKILAARSLDPRVDLLRGLANWFLFLDHIPHNVVNFITLRNFGFTGATDIFVFVTGYAATIFFGRMALERGFVITSTRMLRRLWQLYAAYVVLFVIYIDIVSNVAAQYGTNEIIDEYNVIGIVDHPIRTLMHGLMLQAKPLNLDVLQLFIALLVMFPPMLWLMLRRPNFALAGSVALYVASRVFDWSLPSFPTGSWYFNPFCWQLLSVLGAWFAERPEADFHVAAASAAARRCRNLSRVRAGGDAGGACAGARRPPAGFRYQPVPDRKGKSRVLPRDSSPRTRAAVYLFRAARLGAASIEAFAAGDEMRRGVADLVLRRRVPVLCGALRPDHRTEVSDDTGPGQRERDRDDDGDRLLHFLVAPPGRQADASRGSVRHRS